MKKILLLIICVFLLVAVSGCSKSEQTSDTAENKGSDSQTQLFPEFRLSDLDGNEVSSDIFADKNLTLVNIWTTT